MGIMLKPRMSKVEQWPQIHKQHLNFEMSADDATRTKCGTMIPVVFSDEAMVASTKSVNPRNANFAIMDEPNCCPQSNVDRIQGSIVMDFTKNAWNTDKLRNLKVMIIPIAVSFEDLEVADELTGLTIKAILELQSESTDKQVYPIYNGTDLTGSTLNLGADQLGLTTDEKIEGIAFDVQQMYNALTYMTNGAKLSACIGKIQFKSVSMSDSNTPGQSQGKKNNTVNFNINLPSKVKKMNPYTGFFILIYIPQLGTESQYGIAGDTTPGDHLHIDARWQFLEKNPNFIMESNNGP